MKKKIFQSKEGQKVNKLMENEHSEWFFRFKVVIEIKYETQVRSV